MKITKTYLKQIIKEEVKSFISESKKVAKRRADNAVKFIKAHGNEARTVEVDGVYKVEATKVIVDTKTGEVVEKEPEIIEPTRAAVRDFLEY
jgi:hypothetical protein